MKVCSVCVFVSFHFICFLLKFTVSLDQASEYVEVCDLHHRHKHVQKFQETVICKAEITQKN